MASTKSDYFRQYWAVKRAATALTINANKVLIEWNPQAANGRAYVSAPYTPDFQARMQLYRGVWKKRTGRWSFHPKSLINVVRYCNELYGAANVRKSGFSMEDVNRLYERK